jgi:hypothetical protein
MGLRHWIVSVGLLFPAVAAAADDEYLGRFLARWSGGGSVRFSLEGSPWRVACRLDPRSGVNTITLAGNCRLKFIFFLSNDIEARLRYDPISDSYSGTYVVDGGPPAVLRGWRREGTLTLNVRWPQPVNGHPEAVIVITNDGQRFTLTTIDTIGLNGTPVVTSDLAFDASLRSR